MMAQMTYGVVLITRDRPRYVAELLREIKSSLLCGRCPGFKGLSLVDDSVRVFNRRANRKFFLGVELPDNSEYIDRSIQNILLSRAIAEDYSSIARPLGKQTWSVSSPRNTGAAYWFRYPVDVIIFLDDDILPTQDSDWLQILAERAHYHQGIVGGAIGGEFDESRLERMWRLLSHTALGSSSQKRYKVSGGCMAVSVPVLRMGPFPPWYNEDWIFCIQHEATGIPVELVPNLGLIQRQSGYKLSFPKLWNEAVGEILFRVMMRIPVNCRRVAELPLFEQIWIEERRAYTFEVNAVAELSNEENYCASSKVLKEHRSRVLHLQIPAKDIQRYIKGKKIWQTRFGSECTCANIDLGSQEESASILS